VKNIIGLLLAMLVHGPLCQTAIAKDGRPSLLPLPSVDDFTKGNDGWGFGLGLGIEYESAYEGSDEFGVEVDPAGGIQWRRGNDIFFWAGEALGWRRHRIVHYCGMGSHQFFKRCDVPASAD